MESLIEELDQLPLLHMEHTPAPPHPAAPGPVTPPSTVPWSWAWLEHPPSGR
ncbi:hypothetical protein ACFQ1I_46980 [Kitasatospora arboriphila]